MTAYFKNALLFLVVFVSFSMSAFAAKDYYGIKEVSFDGEKYQMKWSAYTSKGYYIEDFLPSGESLTRFENKFSIFFFPNGIFQNVIDYKLYELKEEKQESQVQNFSRTDVSDSDVIVDVYSKLVQGGRTFVGQNSFFRFLKVENGVVVLEWERRCYDKFEKFENKSAEKRGKYIEELKNFEVPSIVISK